MPAHHKLRAHIRARPATLSAVGAILLLFAWMLDSTLNVRLTNINEELKNIGYQSYLSHGAMNFAISLDDSYVRARLLLEPKYNYASDQLNHEMETLKSDLYGAQSERLKLKNLENIVDALHDRIRYSTVASPDLLDKSSKTAGKIKDLIAKNDEIERDMQKEGFPRNLDLGTKSGVEQFLKEAPGYLDRQLAAAKGETFASLSGEVEDEDDELHKLVEDEGGLRAEQAAIGRMISGALFLIGSILAIYGQLAKDLSRSN